MELRRRHLVALVCMMMRWLAMFTAVFATSGTLLCIVAVQRISMLASIEVMVHHLVRRVVVREGALLAVVIVIVIFLTIVLNGRRVGLILLILLVLIVLAVAVVTTCILVLVDRAKGGGRWRRLVLEWLLQRVGVACVLFVVQTSSIVLILHVLVLACALVHEVASPWSDT